MTPSTEINPPTRLPTGTSLPIGAVEMSTQYGPCPHPLVSQQSRARGCCQKCAHAQREHRPGGDTIETDTSVAHRRAAVDKYLAGLGGARRDLATWHLPVPRGDRGRITIRVTISGSVTAFVEVDRWGGVDAPAESRPWLKANVWPYCAAWCEHTGRANSMPADSSYTCTHVLVADLIDVLRLWIPQELAWQAQSLDVSRAGAPDEDR